MELLKDVGRKVIIVAATTLTACVVQDVYKHYANNDIAKAKFKNNIKKLNPFKKQKQSESLA